MLFIFDNTMYQSLCDANVESINEIEYDCNVADFIAFVTKHKITNHNELWKNENTPDLFKEPDLFVFEYVCKINDVPNDGMVVKKKYFDEFKSKLKEINFDKYERLRTKGHRFYPFEMNLTKIYNFIYFELEEWWKIVTDLHEIFTEDELNKADFDYFEFDKMIDLYRI